MPGGTLFDQDNNWTMYGNWGTPRTINDPILARAPQTLPSLSVPTLQVNSNVVPNAGTIGTGQASISTPPSPPTPPTPVVKGVTPATSTSMETPLEELPSNGTGEVSWYDPIVGWFSKAWGGSSNEPLTIAEQLSKAYGMPIDKIRELSLSNPQLMGQLTHNLNEMNALKFLQDNQGFGWNLPTLQLGFNAVKAFTDWGAARDASKLAKDNLEWQKEKYEEQKRIALEDRERAIAARRYNQGAFAGKYGGSLVATA